MKFYIARNSTGYLTLCVKKPEKIKYIDDTIWYGGDSIKLPPHLYPEVTVENSPLEVELNIKINS